MYEEIIRVAEEQGCSATRDIPLAKYTSFKIGGPAALLVEPNSVDSLSAILKACRNSGVDPLVLGRGSNVLVPDEGVDNVVLLMGDAFSKIEYCGSSMVRAQAGASLINLCRFALEYKLGGLEFAYGIPGSVGGGIYMNAGAYGGEMKDVVMVVSYVDRDGNRGSWQGDEIGLGYRHSNFMGTDLIITSALFKLSHRDPDVIKSKMDGLMQRRRDKQPLNFPSAGSTFKRPEGYFAGKLIQDAGLMGYTVGGAMVSDKHAGFVVNRGGATAADVRALIAHVQETVRQQFGVVLEPEVRIL